MDSLIQAIIRQPKQELKALSTEDIAKLVSKADDHYHSLQTAPLFPDDIYDIVKDELRRRDSTHPVLKRVGAEVDAADDRKCTLVFWMGSLDKIKTDEKALTRWKSKHEAPFMVSDKLDGVSALMTCDPSSGKLSLFTRGDGTCGQDISHLLPFLQNVSDVARATTLKFAIRGELIIPSDTFEKHLKKRGANGRNLVAGMVNAKTPDPMVMKHVLFVPYTVMDPPQLTPSQQMTFLEKTLKFKTVVYHKEITSDDALNVDELSKLLTTRRAQSPFEIDGIVVFHDAKHPLAKNKNPTYAFAFKSIVTGNMVEVIVTNVEWNVSKDGLIKPVVEFDAVPLAGVNIRRATGFNGEYIKDNVIGPGARIVITRSGDVIPYIMSVLTPAASGEPQMPDPNSMRWIWNSTGKDIMLDGDENDDLKCKQLENFVTKINVKGVSSGLVKKLFDAGVDTIPLFVNVSREKLAKIDGFGSSTVDKIYDGLHAALAKLTCVKLMEASNMFGRGFAEKKLKVIVEGLKKHGDVMDDAFVPTLSQLLEVEGVQVTTAKNFLEGLQKFRAFLKQNPIPCGVLNKTKAAARGPAVATSKNAVAAAAAAAEASSTAPPQNFAGKSVVFTGFRNKPLEEEIESRGGTVGTSISKKTSILVTKELDSTSGKAIKARELGVEVISLSEFMKKYGITV